MKTIYTKISASVVMSLLMIMTAGNTMGQRSSTHERRSYSKISRTDSRANDKFTVTHSRYSDKGYQKAKGYGSYSANERNQSSSRDTYSYHKHKYDKKSVPGHSKSIHNYGSPYGQYKKHGHYKNYGHHEAVVHHHYHTPRTYNVWHYPAPWKYSRHAVVFRHDHGDFYYHHGYFYRWHPVRGYFRVQKPSNVVFTYLPTGYREVHVNGRVYYRYGEVYFEYSPYGYRIVPPPAGIYVSVNF